MSSMSSSSGLLVLRGPSFSDTNVLRIFGKVKNGTSVECFVHRARSQCSKFLITNTPTTVRCESARRVCRSNLVCSSSNVYVYYASYNPTQPNTRQLIQPKSTQVNSTPHNPIQPNTISHHTTLNQNNPTPIHISTAFTLHRELAATDTGAYSIQHNTHNSSPRSSLLIHIDTVAVKPTYNQTQLGSIQHSTTQHNTTQLDSRQLNPAKHDITQRQLTQPQLQLNYNSTTTQT
jgi:hypothetical protein